MPVCVHCGQSVEGYAMVRGDQRVCHSDNPDRPDCYRRVTVYREPLGVLRHVRDMPTGVDGIRDSLLSILDEISEFGEEFPSRPAVCVFHKRFVPCRKNNGDCVVSEAVSDIKIVQAYQSGEH